MKIGLYGGSFDPIHHGHLILAREAIEEFGLDRVIFIPNIISPHKQFYQAAPASLRRDMVVAAITGEPKFEIDESELHRGSPSYTIDTVLETKLRYPEADLFYLIGQDNLPELSTWRRIEELALLVKFIVLKRSAKEYSHPYLALNRRIDISATEIRKRIANEESIRYLVPDKVLQMIEQNNLYKEASNNC